MKHDTMPESKIDHMPDCIRDSDSKSEILSCLQGGNKVRSFRDYEIGGFGDAYEACEDVPEDIKFSCQAEIRKAYRGFESGRWHEMADGANKSINHMDISEIKKLNRMYPILMDVASEYSTIEETMDPKKFVE